MNKASTFNSNTLVIIGLALAVGFTMIEFETTADQTNYSNEKVYFDRGVAACNKADWAEAISNLNNAILIDPKDAVALEYRGAAYFEKGDFDHSIKDFSQAIKSDQTNARTFCSRGSAYRAKGELDNALADLTNCLRLDSTNELAYKLRAAIYNSKFEFDKAIKDWDEGLRLNSKDPDALVSRGWAYFMTSQFGKAVHDYEKAIELDPKNDLAYNNLGWLRATCPVAEMRNGKEAVGAATKACELTNWARGRWIDTLAAAYAEASDFQNAVKYQHQALAMEGLTDKERAEEEQRLSLYLQHKPYHEQK